MILEGDLQRAWTPAETRDSRMVFIGRNLDEGGAAGRVRGLRRLMASI